MDQQLQDSSSFERAFAVAQQRHKETVNELHRLREELRARDVVINSLRANLGDRFDAELENRLLKDQLKKLEEGMRRQNEDEMPAYGKRIKIDEATSGESSTPVAANPVLVKKATNNVVKMPLEYLADILSCLDRFSLDRTAFTCPKLRAAVATLNGQNLRSLDSLSLEVTGDDWGTGCPSYTGRPAGGEGEGLRSWDKVSAYRRGLLAQAENRFTIVVQCGPMALKNGATRVHGKVQWNFTDAPKATSLFVGILRNASVRRLANHVVKLPAEYLADILSFLDRFSLDRAEFTCPKLCAAVATLDGQNLRNLSHLDVTGPAREETSFPTRGGEGLRRCGTAAASRRRLFAQAENRFTIVVECSSDPVALKNGATHANRKTQCEFVDAPNATSHFVGLLRNASVQQMMVAHPFCHHFLQALSEADVDVAVGSLAVERFSPDAASPAVGREALTSFNRLETLAIDDAPLDLLSDDFLVAATQKRVTSITLKSDRFYMIARRGGWNVHTPARGQVRAAPGSEWECVELCDGLPAFLFRDDLDESAEVELRFPAARVQEDICLKLLQGAISSGTRYSIDVSFVAVNDVNEQLVDFEEYRRPDGDHTVRYRVPDPSATDVIVELKIATVEMLKEDGAPPTLWKLIEFHRYRKSGALLSWGL